MISYISVNFPVVSGKIDHFCLDCRVCILTHKSPSHCFNYQSQKNSIITTGGYALLTAGALAATSAVPVVGASIFSGFGPIMATLGLGNHSEILLDTCLHYISSWSRRCCYSEYDVYVTNTVQKSKWSMLYN